MEGTDGSPQREGGPERASKEEANEGEIINIHRVPLVRLDHADIRVEEIPPDFVFPEPPKPAAWLLEPPATAAATAPTTGTPLLRVASTALAGSALLATAAWLVHCSLSRRRSFLRRVLEFSAATELALEEEQSAEAARLGRRSSSSSSSSNSTGSISSSCGSLSDRAKEAERQLATLQELIADGLELGGHFPSEAGRRGRKERRRLQACVQRLSRRVAKVEQAAEELRVMAEVEQLDRLLSRLESGGGGVLDGDGLSSGEDGDGALENQSDSDSSDSDMGLSGGNGSAAQEQRRKRRARLSTRARLLLKRRSNGGGDSSVSGDKSATRYVPGCVFREELKGWFDKLSKREQDAVDRLKLGLEHWDLKMMDKCIAQLRLLELPELVKEFQKKREDVRSKRWRLREELKAAIEESNTSRLWKACVEAETFFAAKKMKEYQSAKLCLENACAAELEIKARRILAAKGIVADPRCNVRQDLACGPRLLLREDPVDAGVVGGGGGGTRLFVGADASNSLTASPGVSRRLALLSEGENGEPCHPRDAASSGVTGGDLMGGAHNCGSPLADDGDAEGGRDTSEHTAATASAAGVTVSGNSDSAPWGQPPGRGDTRGGEMMQLCQLRVWELMEARQRSAKEAFQECVTKQEDERRRAKDRHQAALKARDADETHRQECIARLDTRGVIEDKRLKMEMDRLMKEELRREEEEAKRKRRADADRLKQLWSSDGDFFSLLSAADVALAAATAAFRKGFSLAPGAVLNATWGLVVAECAEEGVGGAGTAAGASGAAPHLCTSSAAVDVSDLDNGLAGSDGVCGGAGGAWSEAAAARSSGEGSESALWWAVSAAGSTAGAVLRAAYASAGWLLGQTLGLDTPHVQCEIRVVLSLYAWLVSLVLVMKLVRGLLGPGNGGGAAVQWILLAAWVWGRFHDWVLHASQELVLLFAPAPALVLAYGRALRYFEKHRRPDGFWWVNGLNVRFFWSRALPAIVSGVLACILGSQVS